MLREALRLIRTFHDLKQSELADKLGISKSYLSEIESGGKEPTLALVKKYSEIFDLPVSSIMFFSENIGKGSYQQARALVASKVVKLMKFIEERSGKSHADA
jgi:transcriptional regulator with XRE-family HTH domain